MSSGSESVWTHFWDMHSGGGTKHEYEHILIEAAKEEAKVIFYNRFGTNPDRVSCTCCGEDYSVSEGTLASLTGYHRRLRRVEQKRAGNGRWLPLPDGVPDYLEPGDPEPNGFVVKSRAYGKDRELTLDEFLAREDVLAIYAAEIKDDERMGSVPVQGYVWADE